MSGVLFLCSLVFSGVFGYFEKIDFLVFLTLFLFLKFALQGQNLAFVSALDGPQKDRYASQTRVEHPQTTHTCAL